MNDDTNQNIVPPCRAITLAQWLYASPLPRLEARLLVQKVCAWSHARVIGESESVLPANIQAALEVLQCKRLNGEPMAYLLGEKEFYGRLFKITEDVLIPRPETEHLLEQVLCRLPEKDFGRIWDLGCGSGVLAISLKLERPEAEVWASDLSQSALAVAQENAARLGASIQWAEGDWFDCDRHPDYQSCDVIVSNPPYIDSSDIHLQQGDLRFEPQSALTDFGDGLGAIRQIIVGAGKFLRSGGQLWLEHGFDQGEAVRCLLQAVGFEEMQTIKDYAGWERVTGGSLH